MASNLKFLFYSQTGDKVLTNSKILHCIKFFVCMIRKCFQVQGGSIAVVTTVYNCTHVGIRVGTLWRY